VGPTPFSKPIVWAYASRVISSSHRYIEALLSHREGFGSDIIVANDNEAEMLELGEEAPEAF
jgi:hypothetical protein